MSKQNCKVRPNLTHQCKLYRHWNNDQIKYLKPSKRFLYEPDVVFDFWNEDQDTSTLMFVETMNDLTDVIRNTK